MIPVWIEEAEDIASGELSGIGWCGFTTGGKFENDPDAPEFLVGGIDVPNGADDATGAAVVFICEEAEGEPNCCCDGERLKGSAICVLPNIC